MWLPSGVSNRSFFNYLSKYLLDWSGLLSTHLRFTVSTRIMNMSLCAGVGVCVGFDHCLVFLDSSSVWFRSGTLDLRRESWWFRPALMFLGYSWIMATVPKTTQILTLNLQLKLFQESSASEKQRGKLWKCWALKKHPFCLYCISFIQKTVLRPSTT